MHRAACLALLLTLAVPVAVDAQSYGGAPVPPPAPAAVAPAADWSAQRKARDAMLEAYLAKDPVAYRWFADFPFGVSSGVPYLIVKLLPRLAREQWGSEANFLDVVGLFMDEREPGYPIARGFGFTGLSRADPGGAPDFAALSCGACHIGRVRLADGALRYLDGGVNTQFNLVQYRVRVAATIDKITKGAKTLDERTERATAAILDALAKAHAEDENFFYKNYSFGGKHFDAQYEAEQIALFQKDAPTLVRGFLIRAGLELSSFLDLLAKNYQGFEGPMTAGFGGMADATGVSVSMAFATAKARGETPDPQTALPPTAGLTDFMAVWEQGKRLAHWSADKTSLIDGGGQWNGNIPIPMFRNLAAELTLGLGADTDIRIAAFAERLLRALPAPVYPFEVDLALAKKGEALFAQNCAVCHKPHNGEVYDMGTDLGRARVVSEAIAQGARATFTGICPPSKTVKMPPNGTPLNPCAEFDNVSLENKAEFAMADPKAHDGYNALPLGGVWAQAPYLHNGSVPTLYHLLVPSERPRVFMKGRLDYDKQLVGYDWDLGAARHEEGYRFDTAAFPPLSNKGHDKNRMDVDKTWKLDWSDDKAGALAIIEYLKTR
jgi:mono/diheme cytochrome c family protein